MSKISAGILVFKRQDIDTYVMLLHPGGPFWAKKDVWTIPKGEVRPGENLLNAAKREFIEEVGVLPPPGPFVYLGSLRQPPGKINHIWAAEGDIDLKDFRSNDFTTEWPPKSGKLQTFPECDRAEWFILQDATNKIIKAQLMFLDRLESHILI